MTNDDTKMSKPMSKKEMIDTLKGLVFGTFTKTTAKEREALDMAIKALEPWEQTIQEKQAESEKYAKAYDDGYEYGYTQARLDYEPQPCEDCVSREGAINTIHKIIYGFFDIADDDSEEPINDKDKLLLTINKAISNSVKELPSVTPTRPKGKWIYDYCSICGYRVRPWNNTPYCPNCGADMKKVKDEGL